MRILFLILALLLPTPVLGQVLTGTNVWNGSVDVAEPIRIERGAELIVEPGTQVVFKGGRLEVAGRLQAEGARFSGKNWQGIVLKGCSESTVLRDVIITGAQIGIQVIGGQPLLENNRLAGNRVGIE